MRQATRTPPGMLPAHLAHRRLDLHGRLVRTPIRTMGTINQPAQALFSIADQPHVHGLARHPDLGGHLDDRLSGQHGQHCPVALLDNGQLDKHRSGPQLHVARKRHTASKPITATVNHQLKPECPASAEAGQTCQPTVWLHLMRDGAAQGDGRQLP